MTASPGANLFLLSPTFENTFKKIVFWATIRSLVSKVNGCGGITQNALPANKIFRAFSKALEKTWRKTNLHLRKNNNKLIIGLIC